MDIQQLLGFARENNASDLHIAAGSSPMVRIDGTVQKLNLDPLDDQHARDIIFAILDDEHKALLEKNHEIDFSAQLTPRNRYRINVFDQLRGIAAVFRVIPEEIPAFEDLGLPETLKGLAMRDRGLILVTGPTGCGKSTTLASVIDYLNENTQQHIISIEDPVEYIHANKRCLINQREVGQHTHSFRAALRVAVREDPDVIMVGEMRDLDTISLALTAAETGHLVFSTLHTSGAVKTIDRILDIFPAESKSQIRAMLAESLLAVVSQRLMPNKNGAGRSMALEILVANQAVRNLIREEKVYQIPNVIQSSSVDGMVALDASLADLVQKGKISREDARKAAFEPAKL
jgi:twitching motility protein PilT